jgi:enoyl-CoA hydratase/carnithine racemase
MAYENIAVKEDGDVAIVTLNRPEQRNALSRALRNEFKAFLKNDLDRFNAVVLTGAGPAFCAGMDLKEPVGFGEGQEQWGFFKELFNTDVVFIAAINGPARGAGLTFVSACDLAIADPSANFGMPQITHGIYGGVASTMLSLSLPRKVVGEMVLTGLPLSVERAKEIGLINAVSEPGKSLDVALALAKRIAGFKPEVLSVAKRLLHTLPFDDAKREASLKEVRLLLLQAIAPDDRRIETQYSKSD